jgi:hypothetical protein
MLRFVVFILCAAAATGFSIPKCQTFGINKQEHRLKTSKGLSVASIATESKFLMSTLMTEGTRTINILRYESFGRKLAIFLHPVTIIVFLIVAKSKIGKNLIKGVFDFFARFFRSSKPKVGGNVKEATVNDSSNGRETLSLNEEQIIYISDNSEEKKEIEDRLTQMQRKELADTYNIKVIENRLNSIADSKEKLRLKLDQESNETAYFKNIALQKKIAYQASISKGRAKESEEIRLLNDAKVSKNVIEDQARAMKTISEPIVKETIMENIINASEVVEQQETVTLMTVVDSKAALRLELEVEERAYFKSMALKSKTAYQASLSKGRAKDAEETRVSREAKVDIIEDQAAAMIVLIEEQRNAKLIEEKRIALLKEEQIDRMKTESQEADRARVAAKAEILENEVRGIAAFKKKALQREIAYQASLSKGRAMAAEENRIIEEAKASRIVLEEQAAAMRIVSEEKRIALIKEEQTTKENAKQVDAEGARLADIAERLQSELRGIADFKNKALQNKIAYQASISRGKAIEAVENRIMEEAKASRIVLEEQATAMRIVSEEKRAKVQKAIKQQEEERAAKDAVVKVSAAEKSKEIALKKALKKEALKVQVLSNQELQRKSNTEFYANKESEDKGKAQMSASELLNFEETEKRRLAAVMKSEVEDRETERAAEVIRKKAESAKLAKEARVLKRKAEEINILKLAEIAKVKTENKLIARQAAVAKKMEEVAKLAIVQEQQDVQEEEARIFALAESAASDWLEKEEELEDRVLLTVKAALKGKDKVRCLMLFSLYLNNYNAI